MNLSWLIYDKYLLIFRYNNDDISQFIIDF